MSELCTTCVTEFPEGGTHQCHDAVDKQYVQDKILFEFFIQCGFCSRKASLEAIHAGMEPGWRRKKKSVMHRGYICKECFAHFGK